jgi:choline dehydrogenase-like flavoprotein
VSFAARFPAEVDTIVVGAGTAGAVVAGRLAAGSSERTLLLEAGPDYGPADSGRWPHDLLDATSVAWSHDWGYTGEFGGQVIHFNRARVIGGCSSHNAGAVVFGSRFDYDGWAAAGNAGWSARELQPLFASAWKQLRVRRVGLDELTPFQRACRDAIAASGIPAVEDFNNLDEIAKFPSAGCQQGFDLHIYPVGGYSKDTSKWCWFLGVACLTPLSRGSVRLTGPGLDDKLVIDDRYLSDPGGYDRARLAEGVERVREVAGAPELRRLLGRETRPGPEVSGRQAIASLMPAVTSGNTKMPATVIGERIARSLLGL